MQNILCVSRRLICPAQHFLTICFQKWLGCCRISHCNELYWKWSIFYSPAHGYMYQALYHAPSAKSQIFQGGEL